MAKNPNDRPASAAEVAGKLELFTTGANLARLLTAFEGSAAAAIGNTDETIDPSRIAETLQPGDVSLPDANWISVEPTIDIAQDYEASAASPLEAIKEVPDNRPKSPAALARTGFDSAADG